MGGGGGGVCGTSAVWPEQEPWPMRVLSVTLQGGVVGVGGGGGVVGVGGVGVGRTAEGRAVIDRRHSTAPKRVGSEAVRAMQEAVRRALIEADRAGVPRKAVARALGVSPHTMNAWMSAERDLCVPQGRVAELLFTRGLLPEAVRRRLFARVASLAGFAVVDDVEADRSPLVDQVVDIAAAAGHVAEVIGASCSAASPSGKRLSDAERLEAAEVLRELAVEVAEMQQRIEGGEA